MVLMDIGLPGMSGIDCIRALKRLLPETQIMMLTVFEDHDRIFQSLAAGASGYLRGALLDSHLFSTVERFAGANTCCEPAVRLA